MSVATPPASNADAMFGKNRMMEAGFDVDGDGVVEADELLDLQRLNYATPGGMRRGQMQVPAGGFSRYAHSMTNKAKAERVRREQHERSLLGSPHLPKNTRVFAASGEVTTMGAWEGSDLVSGQRGVKEIKANGREFTTQRRSDAKLKNHETKDRAKFTPKKVLPKQSRTAPSGTANARSPLSGSHTSDQFADAHAAFTKDEHIDRARLHAQTGQPNPKAAPTEEAEERYQTALALTSRASPSVVEHLLAVFGVPSSIFGVVSSPDVTSPTSPTTTMVPAEEMVAKSKASAEKLYPETYNGSYTAVVQETNAMRATDTRQYIMANNEDIQLHEQAYLDTAAEKKRAVNAGKTSAELAKEEVLRARQLEAEELTAESKRLAVIDYTNRMNEQKEKNERAARSFDQRYLTIDEMVETLQQFSPEEASLTPRSVYTMEPASRSPTEAYLAPFQGLSDSVVKANAKLFSRIHNVGAKTDDDVDDETAGAARATMAAKSKATKLAKAKKLAAQNEAIKKRIANVEAIVDADYDETPLNKND